MAKKRRSKPVYKTPTPIINNLPEKPVLMETKPLEKIAKPDLSQPVEKPVETPVVEATPEPEKAMVNRDITILYNPKHPKGADIKDIHAHKAWIIKVNTLAAWPTDFANYLVEKYGFLVRVAADQVKEFKRKMDLVMYKCDICNYEVDSEEKLRQHREASHSIDRETEEILEGIPVITMDQAPRYISYQDQVNGLSPENQEGIPDTVAGTRKDKDGVSWYGDGWTNDRGVNVNNFSGMSRKSIPGVKPGSFGAA